jgi:hypothetical protein
MFTYQADEVHGSIVVIDQVTGEPITDEQRAALLVILNDNDKVGDGTSPRDLIPK